MPAGQPARVELLPRLRRPSRRDLRRLRRRASPRLAILQQVWRGGSRRGGPRRAGGTAAPHFPAALHVESSHLAEKILTARSAIEGERKQVTVMFADLKGSMELLADRDPEEARTLLDPILELMIEAVHRYEGTLNQVMGGPLKGRGVNQISAYR